jgi:two-component system, OmpR family, alkaline phosphatase synthesis response regulator PhoP
MSDKKRILVVDDEQEICDLIKSILERTGRFEVLISSRAQEGIELARLHKPDLILLDVMMPDMEGTEVARILCEDDQTKAITIVFVTAIAIPMAFLASLVSNEELKQKAGPVGGHYFIQKPIAPKELIQRIDEILGSVPLKTGRIVEGGET